MFFPKSHVEIFWRIKNLLIGISEVLYDGIEAWAQKANFFLTCSS
jgi:hypothetical protein